MDYLEKAQKEIRETWFENHIVKKIEGNESLQRIVWGEPRTRMYQVEYILSGNNVFISGDLGHAVYVLPCYATLEKLKSINLSAFTKYLTAHEKKRWDFDWALAQKQIEEYFLDWNDVDSMDELEGEKKELYQTLMDATVEWDTSEAFETMGVWATYQNTNIDWFDGETAEAIADFGKRLPFSFISYWVGLQMVIEYVEGQKLQSQKFLDKVKGEFPTAFINENNELILEPINNIFLSLNDIKNELDFKCKLLAWLSRPSCKGLSDKWQTKIRNSLNKLLGTNFSKEEMRIIYGHLGNDVNRMLSEKFIQSDYDLLLLNKEDSVKEA